MSVTFTGTGSIELPNPEFGNSFFNDKMDIVNRSRGGLLSIFFRSDASRVEKNRYSVTWRNLSRDKARALQTFILANLGNVIFYDGIYNGTQKILILTPEANTANEGREMCTTAKGRRSISLEMEILI